MKIKIYISVIITLLVSLLTANVCMADQLLGMPTKYKDLAGNRIYDYGPYEGLSYSEKINLITGGQKKTLSRSESKDWCDKLMCTVEVPVRDVNKNPTKIRLTVNKYLAYDVICIFEDIFYQTDYCVKSTSTASYCHRPVAGTSRLSFHGYGSAIDINWNDNLQSKVVPTGPYGFTSAKHPVVQIFNKYGWGWGGDWTGTTPDYMHFSFTDE